MTFEIYKLYARVEGDHVYIGRKSPQLITTIDTGDQFFHIYMMEHPDLEIPPGRYHVINKERNDFYILWNENGYWYYDGARYEDRLIIAADLRLTRDQARAWREKD